MCDGLGGGNEILGGIWVLMISWVAIRTSELSRVLNYLGLLVGIAGILSALPGFGDAGLLFGLLQIPWFIWLGIILMRNTQV